MKKHDIKLIRIVALTLAAVFSFTLSAGAFDWDENTVYTDSDYLALIDAINDEYGTEFRALTASEAEEQGIEPRDTDKIYTAEEMAEIEAEFKYLAEIKIPEYEAMSDAAEASLLNPSAPISQSPFSLFSGGLDRPNGFLVEVQLNGFMPFVFASTVYTINNVLVWGSVMYYGSSYDPDDSEYFITLTDSATIVDLGRNIYYYATGAYYSNQGGGTYLGTGSQYHYFYVR
jgi:hypothetical protein